MTRLQKLALCLSPEFAACCQQLLLGLFTPPTRESFYLKGPKQAHTSIHPLWPAGKPFHFTLAPTGLQPMMSNQQQTYQGVMGVQQPQSPGLLNSQRSSMGGQMQSVMGVQQPQPPSLLSSQRSGMGGQMQGLVVQYTPLPSYQVGIGLGVASAPQPSPLWGGGGGAGCAGDAFELWGLC